MEHKPRQGRRILVAERERLIEPVRVSTAIVDYARHATNGRPIVPVPTPPNQARVIHGRPIVDVDLPVGVESTTDEPGVKPEPDDDGWSPSAQADDAHEQPWWDK